MRLVLMQPRLGRAQDRSNLDAIITLLERHAPALERQDLLLLPEAYELRPSRQEYLEGLRELAAHFGCHVVGGSHHEGRGEHRVNCGVVVDPDGHVLGTYEKLRPYASERSRVQPGQQLGELTLAGRRVLILVCADFWFSDLAQRVREPADLILVPALSVTRKSSPDFGNALWRHLSIARAYEFAVYVGISDWAPPQGDSRWLTSGVAGFADPTGLVPDAMFAAVPKPGVRVVDLDFDALAAFRRDRADRGFLWQPM